MRKWSFGIIRWYITPFRIEPLAKIYFVFGGHVKLSRKGILLIKYSRVKRNSEFNQKRKGGNNEVQNWNYLDCVLKVAAVTFYYGSQDCVSSEPVGKQCAFCDPRTPFYSCNINFKGLSRKWNVLSEKLGNVMDELKKGLLLKKKASWPWRNLFLSEVLALLCRSHEINTRLALHVTFWCYLESLGENNHYFTLKQLTTALSKPLFYIKTTDHSIKHNHYCTLKQLTTALSTTIIVP